MTITRISDGTKSAGGTGAVTLTYESVAADRMVLCGRAIWNGDASVFTEAGFTNTAELSGGTGTVADSHTSIVRVDRRVLDGSETGDITPNQSTVSGAIGVMPVYAHGGGGWDSVAASTGTDDTHGTGRSVTGSSTISFQPGDVLVAFVSVDTDATTAWTAKTLAASGITFGGDTETVHDSTTGGVATGNDGNIMVLQAVVTAGTGTVAPSLTMTGGPSNCGPVAFIRLRETAPSTTPVSNDLDVRWKSWAQITKDVDLRWTSRAQVSQDTDLRWRSRVQVTSDVDLRWRSRVSVSQDTDLRWRSYAAITSDLDVRWRSRAQVSQDTDLRWRVAVRVTGDVDVRWRVYTPVQNDVEARWRVYVPVTADTDLRWRTWALVASSTDLRWRVYVPVAQDVDVRWRSFAQIQRDIDLRWIVDSSLVVVTSGVDLRWRVWEPVSSDVDMRWRVAASVSADMDLRWVVRHQVTSDVDLRWAVLVLDTEVVATIDLRWIVEGGVVIADAIVTLTTAMVMVTIADSDAVSTVDGIPLAEVTIR